MVVAGSQADENKENVAAPTTTFAHLVQQDQQNLAVRLDRQPEVGPGRACATAASERTPVLLMDKRQLVRALNSTFLGELKSNLIERLHEFTDCAYTKHEHREQIVALLTCVKFQLNKLVKLIYRLVSVGARSHLAIR